MSQDNLAELKKPEPVVDGLIMEILRDEAKKLLDEALEAEIAGFLSQYADLKDDQGRMRVAGSDYLPKREIYAGVSPVPAKAPRIQDSQPKYKADRIRFNSSIVLSYLRKTKSMKEVIPGFYLKGISTGDFREVLVPKSIQVKAKEKLHMVWMAPEKDEAEKHLDDFDGVKFINEIEENREIA
ncbi:hypothetical protein M1N00_02455 [Thermodesulfovibrionales bacterium]|nr:hypothetical protein [Thermodesulfovibrionales bacterium]